jgi:hypothetical protein
LQEVECPPLTGVTLAGRPPNLAALQPPKTTLLRVRKHQHPETWDPRTPPKPPPPPPQTDPQTDPQTSSSSSRTTSRGGARRREGAAAAAAAAAAADWGRNGSAPPSRLNRGPAHPNGCKRRRAALAAGGRSGLGPPPPAPPPLPHASPPCVPLPRLLAAPVRAGSRARALRAVRSAAARAPHPLSRSLLSAALACTYLFRPAGCLPVLESPPPPGKKPAPRPAGGPGRLWQALCLSRRPRRKPPVCKDRGLC